MGDWRYLLNGITLFIAWVMRHKGSLYSAITAVGETFVVQFQSPCVHCRQNRWLFTDWIQSLVNNLGSILVFFEDGEEAEL